jgi:hypothetical protein
MSCAPNVGLCDVSTSVCCSIIVWWPAAFPPEEALWTLFLFTVKSPATMSMPQDPGHCPRLSLPKFPFAAVFLKSCHLRSCGWVSKSERSLHRAIRNLELMKHRRFLAGYWRAHWYRKTRLYVGQTQPSLLCCYIHIGDMFRPIF